MNMENLRVATVTDLVDAIIAGALAALCTITFKREKELSAFAGWELRNFVRIPRKNGRGEGRVVEREGFPNGGNGQLGHWPRDTCQDCVSLKF